MQSKDRTLPKSEGSAKGKVKFHFKERKPEWFKTTAPGSANYLTTRRVVKKAVLNTVCEEARCPNIGECWSHKTATFMIMGDTCARGCRFCAIKKQPAQKLPPLDADEPKRIAEAARELNLKHVVITTVTRDDLPDGGADHFAKTVTALKSSLPDCSVEVLISDLNGSKDALKIILATDISILNHNVETVPRLYNKVRPGSEYIRSLTILRWSKELYPEIKTKSGLMVGFDEKKHEVLSVMDDLRACGVDILTIGQYLQPSNMQLAVERYVSPEEFKFFKEEGLKRGFSFVESGPFVRSSYHAWKHSKVADCDNPAS